MKRIILLGMFFFIFTSSVSLYAQWARTYGGDRGEIARSICTTQDGGYIVAVQTYSFGEGLIDYWILKLNSEGDIEWQKTYGGSDYDNIKNLIQTNDGGYIVAGDTFSFGAGDKDFWILKLGSNGDIEWQKTYGGSEKDASCSIQQTNDGGYIAAGFTSSFGTRDLWILRLDSAGLIDWQKVYGGYGSDAPYYAWVQQTNDGGFIIATQTDSWGAEKYDIWILKLNSKGDIEWQRTYGGSNRDDAASIKQTVDGGYIIAGATKSFGNDKYDSWVLKLTHQGDIEWQKIYRPSKEGNHAYSIEQTIDGDYIVAGYNGFTPFQSLADVLILKLSVEGEIEWQKTYGGSMADGSDGAYIQQIKTGEYIVACGFGGRFGTDSNPDLLILKLSQNGNIQYCYLAKDSNTSALDTSIIPVDTNVIPVDSNIIPQSTNISPQDTDATEKLLCEDSKFILTILAAAGGTTDPSPGTYTYDPGTQVSITANPNSGYEFTGWSGDASGTTNPITITMDGDKSITASFTATSTGGDDGGDTEGGGAKKGCFIATAAYGTPIHPHVNILRDFRDTYLMPSKLGRMLVNLYYKYSPFVANLIAKNKVLKVAVRINLLPLVAFSYSMLHFGPIITSVILVFIFMLPLFLISFWRKRILKRLKNYDI